MTPGTYQLYLRLDQPTTVEVGRLGTFDFPVGRYVYTGSALGGLEARVNRHLRSEKKLRWHIDHLLLHARITRVRTFPSSDRLECELNACVLLRRGARVPVTGFGSSDCRCASHLVYLGR
jgi:Uri superfamily endonuclease